MKRLLAFLLASGLGFTGATVRALNQIFPPATT